jgi:hypothetical protein
MQRLPAGMAAAALAVAFLGVTPLGEAAKRLVIPRNSVTTVHIRNGTIQRADLAPSTIAYLTAAAPTPRGRGVTVSNGENGERTRVTAATIRRGDALGQVTYLGGLTCPNSGPDIRLEGAFFDANGTIVDTGIDLRLSPTPGTRYPFELLGITSAVRAEVVVSISCF